MANEVPVDELLGFEALPVAAAVLELDGTAIAVNAAARRMLGRDAGQVLGRKVGELGPHLRSAWPDFIAAGEHTGELTLANSHGPRTFEYTLSTRVVAGRTVVLAFAMDITRYARAHRETVEQERAVAARQRLGSLGLVAGGMAHELNNLLVSVVAETSVLREEATSDGTRDAIARIETAAKRMTHLTHQLLAYTGRGRFVTSLVEPDALLDEKREPLARRLPIGAQVDVTAGAGQVAVEADRGLLRQVIRELVDNAAEALHGGLGHVRVASRVALDRDREWWELEVRDNGAGMDAATQQRIFDPFFTTKPKRHGLGLSAVLGIVKRLGGDISVSSELGVGSTFRVRLPIVPGAAAPRRRSTSEQPMPLALAGMRVLLVDDEPTVRATVSRLLARRGAVPVLAASGAEAEKLLRAEKFDLVLCDVVMPDRNGYELVPFVRTYQPGTRIILMSGYSEHPNASEPPDGFIEKPFTAGMLEEAIRAAMAGEAE